MRELKIEYNKLVVRLKNAEKFFEGCKGEEEINKYMPLLKTILNESQKILNKLADLGVEFTSDDVVEGFDIENKL